MADKGQQPESEIPQPQENVFAKKAPSPSVKVFQCKECGASVSIRCMGSSLASACQSCGSVIDISNAEFNVIQRGISRAKVPPIIPLGQRGKLRGNLWEMVGFMVRRDPKWDFSWQEYLLFNPRQGFRWLTQIKGHWNYVVMTKEKPVVFDTASRRPCATMYGHKYYLFQDGMAEVVYVLGEFYWRVRVGQSVMTHDYVCPPQILSSEKDADEIVWSIAEYIEPEEVMQAFGIAVDQMPEVEGIAPNEPSPFNKTVPLVMTFWAMFIAIAMGIQFFAVATAKRTEVLVDNYYFSSHKPVIATPSFKLEDGTGNVHIRLTTPVSNQWFYTSADLVNDGTEDTYSYDQTIEYYFGSDSDGAWSEGGNTKSKLISSVPDGTYHLEFQPQMGSAVLDWPFTVEVTRKVVNWWNFLWALVLLSLYPIYVWWQKESFEQTRWQESDYSPYYSEDEGDDSWSDD